MVTRFGATTMQLRATTSALLLALSLAGGAAAASCSAAEEGGGAYCGTETVYPEASPTTIPQDLRLDGPNGSFDPSAEFTKCGQVGRLLVLRVTAPWCGTCGWHSTHWADEVSAESRGRLTMVDVVVGDRSNDAPSFTTATDWAATAVGTSLVVLDPDWKVSRDLAQGVQLPAYVYVDPRTMGIVAIDGNPTSAAIEGRVRNFYASATGEAERPSPEEKLYDGRFTREEWDMIREATLPGKRLRPDPSNRVADNPIAAAIGRTFFMETEWSANGAISCQTCHTQASGCADSLPLSKGMGETSRNAPTVLMAGHREWFFADGRADSAWMQALQPIEDANEFGSNRLRVVHLVATKFATEYERAFGEPVPDLSDKARFPVEGKPGMPSFDGMAEADRTVVNHVFANVGKAIAAYERTIFVTSSPFDRYVSGDLQALSDDQKLGMKEMFQHGCMQCHFGSTLSDEAFHSLRFPTGHRDGSLDHGRAAAIAGLDASEFSRSGPHSDDRIPMRGAPANLARYEGAFKTPTLRAVASTGPYGHGGSISSLEELVELYRTPGLAAGDPRASGIVEPWVPAFTAEEGTHMATFLRSFAGGAQWW